MCNNHNAEIIRWRHIKTYFVCEHKLEEVELLGRHKNILNVS